MVRFGLQQVLQLLTSFAAVAVFFFHQRQQEPVIEVGIAQEQPAFGTEFVVLRGWPAAARAAQRELRLCAFYSGFRGLSSRFLFCLCHGKSHFVDNKQRPSSRRRNLPAELDPECTPSRSCWRA